MRLFAVFLCLLGLLSAGCAASLAARHTPDYARLNQLPRIRLFESRHVVLARLGPPVRTQVDQGGQRVDTYMIQQGDDTAPTRARLHGAMSTLTFGTWDVVGVPLELLLDDTSPVMGLHLTYDSTEMLVSIKTTP